MSSISRLTAVAKDTLLDKNGLGIFLGGMVLTGVAQPLLMRYGVNQQMPAVVLNTGLLIAQGIGARIAVLETGDKFFKQPAHAYGALSTLSGGSQFLGAVGAPVRKAIGLVAGSVPQVASAVLAWTKGSRIAQALYKNRRIVQRAIPLVTAVGTLGLLGDQALQTVAHDAPSSATITAGAVTAVGCLAQGKIYRWAYSRTGNTFAWCMSRALKWIAAGNIVAPVAAAVARAVF